MHISTTRAKRIGLVLCATLAPALGCSCAAPAPESRQSAPPPQATTVAPEAPTPLAPTPPAAAAPPPAPREAEVEFVGKVTVPRQAKGTLRVWVCDGTCFANTALWLAQITPSKDGGFGGEVFVPQGTTLWFCAGVVGPTGDIVWRGGSNEPFLAQGDGELVPPRLAISLRAGPKVAPPRPLNEPP